MSLWMRLALEEGERALENREVPVGCVIVLPEEHSPTGEAICIAVGSNETNATGDATRHAEVVAIEKVYAGGLFGFDRCDILLSKCTLYVTCEPCIMCAGALNEVKIQKVVFGCRNDKFGGMGSVESIIPDAHIHQGILKEEAVELFNRFFKRANPQSKAILEMDDI